MKPSELQEKTCHQFDCAIKTVIRHRAIDFYRAIRRSEKKEMPFAEIMDDLLNSIGTEDTYSTDYVAVFEVCGETTLIISKKPGNTGISRDIRTEFTTDLLLSD